jgi:O-antigen/teichoic acid export membrane protein
MYVSFGVFLYGIADFFNRFIGANGGGKMLRNASFIVGIVALMMNLLFIPQFAEYGASYAKVATGAIYTIVIYLYYRKVVKNKKCKIEIK